MKIIQHFDRMLCGLSIGQSMFFENLIAYANSLSYEPGRQGTGYEKAAVAKDRYESLRITSLKELGVVAKYGHQGEFIAEGHDCYFLRYPEKSHIPLHLDDAPFGKEHRRFNLILLQPYKGGELYVEGHRIDLLPGDAYIFRPDKEEHEVRLIQDGVRLVWTVGVLA